MSAQRWVLYTFVHHSGGLDQITPIHPVISTHKTFSFLHIGGIIANEIGNSILICEGYFPS